MQSISLWFISLRDRIVNRGFTHAIRTEVYIGIAKGQLSLISGIRIQVWFLFCCAVRVIMENTVISVFFYCCWGNCSTFTACRKFNSKRATSRKLRRAFRKGNKVSCSRVLFFSTRICSHMYRSSIFDKLFGKLCWLNIMVAILPLIRQIGFHSWCTKNATLA